MLITSLLIATASAVAYVTLQWTTTATVAANPKVCFFAWSAPTTKLNTFDYGVYIFPSIKTVDENITHGVWNWDTESHVTSVRWYSLTNSGNIANLNVTVHNSTSVQGNKITSGVTGNNGQMQLLNLPNNTLTFTQYGGASYSLVIGNTTQLVSSENQTITLTADQNNINTNNNYSIIAFAGMTIPFKSSFVTNRLKKKMQKRSETNEDSSEEVLS